MTYNAKRSNVHAKLAGLPGVRSVRRPVTPGSAERFDLYYIRNGTPSEHPLVVIPGGPGLASVQLYRGLRRRAVRCGLEVIMVEHRGVGMSRHDDTGADLTPEAITVDQVVDDIAAVLDDAQVGSAIVYGTSYGSYVAAGLGVRHPGRVHAMILDSPVLSARDIDAMRGAVRGLLLDGTSPDGSRLAPKVRRLMDMGALTSSTVAVATAVYGYGGVRLLERQLDLLLRGRTLLWRGVERVSALSTRKVPYHNEFDLAGRIAFRELDYVGKPDGLPLDPSESMRAMRDQVTGPAPEFEAEPYDLTAEMPRFSWPTAVLSGGRDLITPPAVAERVATLIPDAALVRLPSAAHSVIDFRQRAALKVIDAVRRGQTETLPGRSAELDALPNPLALRVLMSMLAAAAAVEKALPAPATS
jgi:pimeloyl-ACP methyl ester carboxylesterase